MNPEHCMRFVPSRVEGLLDVSEVAVYPDRLEVMSAGRWVPFRFVDIAHWPSPVWLRRLLSHIGWRPQWLPVADRDWFHDPPSERFFAFYTTPPVIVYMPTDESAENYAETYFVRMDQLIATGGFSTFDLG